MELRDAIKVLDSDAHARDPDTEIKPYLPEPYRNQRALCRWHIRPRRCAAAQDQRADHGGHHLRAQPSARRSSSQ